MILSHLFLQGFRSYSSSDFTFNKGINFIVGANTAGKTNLIEAIYLLARGKSFRAEKDFQMIRFGEELGRVKGEISESSELEVVIAKEGVGGRQKPFKKFLVNGVPKRRIGFAGNLAVVLFSPVDLDIVVDSPSLRRRFLDEVLEQVDREYLLASIFYEKSLRQRNALLGRVKETLRQTQGKLLRRGLGQLGERFEKEFEYWDNLLIKNGELITRKREEFFEFLNLCSKDIFDFTVDYDKSVISKERLLYYQEAEIGAGVTLVGPHRDDFNMRINPSYVKTSEGKANKISANKSLLRQDFRGQGESVDVKFFGSRGQQRLAVLQLKVLQLDFMEKKLGERPILLLDDIFSELDSSHIRLISQIGLIGKQQTIMTTTHEEFIDNKLLKTANVIELKK